MPVVKKIFTGGINSDDASYLVDPKEYLNAVNARFITSESGEVGKVMPVEGTTLKAQTINSVGTTIPFVLPAGTNQVIGAVEDATKRRVVWFVWNSLGSHAVYCYDADTDRVYKVLEDVDVTGGLNFQQAKFIHSCSIVYGILYWTDNNSQPRRINIEAGIVTHHPTFVTSQAPYTTPMDQSIITVIRPQPTYPMTVAYAADANLKLVADGFQGAYRFGYRDKEYSTFSMFSRASLPIVGLSVFTGYLTFTIPLTQKIAQDVQIIEAAVKFPGSKMFIQKRWDKSNATDAAAIAAHNAGTTALSFNFYADSVGVAVDDATAFKAYDDVPIVAATMDVAKDRLFFANTINGYKMPDATPSGFGTLLGSALPVPIDGARVMKSGSTYKLGIVYYDEFGRSSGVVAGPTLTVPFHGDQGPWYGNSTWTFLNTTSAIPLWAKHYSIVRTKSKKCTTFLQFRVPEWKYVTKDTNGAFVFSATPPTNTSDIYGIGLKASTLYNTGYGYSFTDGDLVQVAGTSATYILNVLNQYSDFIIVEYNANLGTPTQAEIYTPVPATSVEYYYEVGQKYDILNPGTPSRSFAVTSGPINGDVYLKSRTYVFGATPVTKYYEVMNMVDQNWQSWYTDAGRGMTEIFTRIERQPTNICFSEPFTIGVNGLSTFNALDANILPNELDSIQRIITTSKVESQGGVLLVIGEQETASQYIGESQVFDNTGSSFLAKSSGVLGNLNVLKGSYGTLHPESVFGFGEEVVFFDVNKGCVVRYSVNGLTPISDNKMRKYWRKVGQDIMGYYKDPTVHNQMNPNTPMKVLGMVDPFNNEYLMYTPNMSTTSKSGYIQDITNICTLYNYEFPVGATSMLYTLPLVPGTMYYFDTLWRETTVTYNGQDLFTNPYFIAVPGVNQILISSPTQFSGDFTLCDVMKSYYDTYDGNGGIVSFSIDIDKWVTKYSYIPEWMCNIVNRLASFKNGNLYIHNGAYNSFYGSAADTIMVGMHNDNGNSIKVYDSVAVEGDAPRMVHFKTEDPNVQSTNVLSSEFVDKEGVKYSPILRDRLSPNVTGTYDQKMWKGDKLRGEVCKFTVVYSPAGNATELEFVNIGFNGSNGQTV
jgi:hypothetical protein